MILRIKQIILLVQKLFLSYEKPDNELGKKYSGLNDQAPVFIVGAPRTGSTVLFQLLSCYTRVTYISNLMAMFPRYMAIIHRLTKYRIDNNKEVKESNYGIISGLHAPNEASKIFDFWINMNSSAQAKSSVKTTVYRITRQSNCPLLVKSMGVSVKLSALKEYFPNAKIVFIKRNALYTAQSILKARLDINGDANAWWSIKPLGYESVLSMPPPYQVLWQVQNINQQIERALRETKLTHVAIDYQQLCINPLATVATICDKLGIERRKNFFDLEKVNLRYSEKKIISDLDYKQLLEESKKFTAV